MTTKTIHPVLNDQNRPSYVGPGCTNQGGALKLHSCSLCGKDVVWVKSARTGKYYTAFVFKGAVVRYYRKDAVHTRERCQQEVQRRQVDRDKDALFERNQDLVARCHAFRALGFDKVATWHLANGELALAVAAAPEQFR